MRVIKYLKFLIVCTLLPVSAWAANPLIKQDLLPVEKQTVLTLVKKHFYSEIKDWEREIPGISNWLFEAMSVPWYLHTKPIPVEPCEPLSSKGTAICYTLQGIIIDQKAFDAMTEPDQARIILDALFGFHTKAKMPKEPAFKPKKKSLL